MPGIQSLVDMIVAALVFGLVLTLWLIGAFLWARHRSSRTQQLHARLGLHDDSTEMRTLRLWKDGHEATTTVPYFSAPIFTRLENLCKQAGWQSPLASICFGLAGAMTVLFALTLVLTKSYLGGLAVCVMLLVLFWMSLKRRISRRLVLFERQFIDALELASRSLRAGHPLVGSFRLISEEIAAPGGAVFAEICQRQAMGASLNDAIERGAEISGSGDMQLFSTSVVIQLRSGGNLADMMDRLAYVIRDRLRLNRRVRVLTAQTQFSKRVLLGLPFMLFGLLNLLNPTYMAPLYSTYIGQMVLLLASGGILLGAFVMNRLSVLRY